MPCPDRPRRPSPRAARRLAALGVVLALAAVPGHPARAQAKGAGPAATRAPARPYGTLLYATRVAELGATVALLPGTRGLATGVHYREVDGIFGKVLLLALEMVGAQAEANATGEDQYVDVDPRDYAGLSLAIDAYTPQLGGGVTGAKIDVTWRFAWMLPWGLPLVANAGVSALTWDDVPAPGQSAPATAGVHTFTLTGVVLFPLGRYLQVRGTYRFGLVAATNLVSLAATVNLGDGAYARVTGMYMGGPGVSLGAGVRL